MLKAYTPRNCDEVVGTQCDIISKVPMNADAPSEEAYWCLIE